MKRLISVLAIALILILMSWGAANSVGAPVRIDEAYYDHPWGGEHLSGDLPNPVADPKEPVPDIQRSGDFRSWITNWFFNSIYYLKLLPKGDITIDIVEDTNNDNNVNNNNFRGSGR